jgi:hypothetical protein
MQSAPSVLSGRMENCPKTTGSGSVFRKMLRNALFLPGKASETDQGLVSQSQKLCLLTFPETVSGVRDGLKLEPSAPRILVISICHPCLVVATPRKMPKTPSPTVAK